MKSPSEKLMHDLEAALGRAKDSAAVEAVRVDFLGRKGRLAGLMAALANLPEAERRETGRAVNEAKQKIQELFTQKANAVASGEQSARDEREWVDVTEPGTWPAAGHLHPVSTAIVEITDILARIGFVRVRAPEIDWDWYAFESLNMPKDHPARDDWETFFIEKTKTQAASGEKGKIVLTPHTSNAQVRELEKGRLPIRMININRTYRRQSDITHTPMFHQFEGMMIDEGLTIAHLKGVLDFFVKSYFGPNRTTRLRPHHFRFTEPSIEIDISCGLCGGKGKNCRVCKSGWLELGGGGMMHPHVLKAGGLDPEKYTGFAFGWGVERTLTMREGISIDDIRILYRDDVRFVQQF